MRLVRCIYTCRHRSAQSRGISVVLGSRRNKQNDSSHIVDSHHYILTFREYCNFMFWISIYKENNSANSLSAIWALWFAYAVEAVATHFITLKMPCWHLWAYIRFGSFCKMGVQKHSFFKNVIAYSNSALWAVWITYYSSITPSCLRFAIKNLKYRVYLTVHLGCSDQNHWSADADQEVLLIEAICTTMF